MREKLGNVRDRRNRAPGVPRGKDWLEDLMSLFGICEEDLKRELFRSNWDNPLWFNHLIFALVLRYPESWHTVQCTFSALQRRASGKGFQRRDNDGNLIRITADERYCHSCRRWKPLEAFRYGQRKTRRTCQDCRGLEKMVKKIMSAEPEDPAPINEPVNLSYFPSGTAPHAGR